MGREQHAPISPAALLRLVEQLAADQHAADLAGAGADLVELGIAQQAARRIVVDIAVAAQRLDGLQRHPGRLLGGEENRPGGVLARGPAAVAGRSEERRGGKEWGSTCTSRWSP